MESIEQWIFHHSKEADQIVSWILAFNVAETSWWGVFAAIL